VELTSIPKAKRGLATLSKERRKEIASMGGKSISKEIHSKAGKRGSNVTRELYGKKHYSIIGKLGGKAKRKKKVASDESSTA
jgi:hypothetical protein